MHGDQESEILDGEPHSDVPKDGSPRRKRSIFRKDSALLRRSASEGDPTITGWLRKQQSSGIRAWDNRFFAASTAREASFLVTEILRSRAII